MVGILKRLFSRTFNVIERAEALQVQTNLIHQRAKATIDGETEWMLRNSRRVVLDCLKEGNKVTCEGEIGDKKND